MDLPEPKRKKYCRLPQKLPLPVILQKDESIKKIQAYFNGFSVVVEDLNDMQIMVSQGYFGKANFSRSYPQFTKHNNVNIIRRRQFNNRKKCIEKFSKKNYPEKVIVVPDSDSDNDDYFTNLQPKYEIDCTGIKEKVWLGLEEAFFLASTVKCLDVRDNYDQKLDVENLWSLFQNTEPNFIQNYIVYFYYRAKNWVVKPGLKFGGDFMLYKEGPPFYHATYIVIIEVVDESGKRIENLTNCPMDNVSILGLNRLCETAGKELLICRIKWPKVKSISYEDLTNVEVQEIMVRRWIASQEREEM